MFAKIKIAIQSPLKIWYRFIWLLRQIAVRKVNQNGRVYYKYKGQLFPDYLNKGNAMSYILDKAKIYCNGKGIDIGADKWVFPGAIAIQNEKDQNAYELSNFNDNELDYVFSSHCLEHLDRWQKALALWIKKLKQDGILFLYLPHSSMLLWQPGAPWVGSFHKWSPTYAVINKFLLQHGMAILDYNDNKDEYWSFHIIAKKLSEK